MNRLINAADAIGSTVYSYNAAGQLLSDGGLWPDDTVSYAYNNRWRTGLSVQAPNSSPWTESYGYDAAKRLTNVTSQAGSFGYSYDPQHPLRVRKLALPNTAYVTNQFDTKARLNSTSLRNSSGTTLDAYSDLSYDTHDLLHALQRASSTVATYAYDRADQLTSLSAFDPGPANVNRLQEQLQYGYDRAGNLSSLTKNALAETFNVNTLNELTTVSRSGTLTVAGTTTSPATNVSVNGIAATTYSDNTFAKDGFTITNGNNTYAAVAKDSHGRSDTNTSICNLPATNSFIYDLNGNLLTDGNRSFAYDDENQLVSVWVTNVWRSDFVYDGKMRRRLRFESTWNGSAWVTNTTVRYIYAGMLVIEERNEHNLPLVFYTRGNDLSGTLQGAGGIGGLLARTDLSTLNSGPLSTSAHAYYFSDWNGNVSALINTSQLIVAKYLYDPFGNVLSQGGPLAAANLYRFSSKEAHANSGTCYYGYRFYDPELQRWINRDPLGEDGGFNLHEFADNGPVNKVDPFGLAVPALDSVDANPSAAMDLIIDDIVKSTGMGRAQVIKRISLCASIHATYKALNCKGCGFGCVTKSQAAERASCLASEVGLRATYLRLKCDYFLPGSITRGSATAEAGHKIELANKTGAMVKCTAKAAP